MDAEKEILDIKDTIQSILIVQTEHEQRHKVSEHRIDDLEGSNAEIKDICISIERLAVNMDQMVSVQKAITEELKEMAKKQEEDRRKMDERLTEVENRPFQEKSKRYDKYVFEIVLCIIGLAVAYLFAVALPMK